MVPKKYLRIAGWILTGAVGLWLFAAVLLPILLPFLIGLLLALLVERPLHALLRRTRLPRRLASFLCVLSVFAVLGVGLFFLLRTLFSEIMGFIRQLPTLAQEVAVPLARLESQLLELAGKLPDGIGTGLRSGIRNLFESGAGLGAKVYEWFFRFASGFLGKAPGILLFLVTTVLSSFMFSGELPALRAYLQQHLPDKWRTSLHRVLGHLKSSLGGWLRAQLKLMGILFLLITIGLMLLGTDYPFLFGLLIALVDALPVLGTGVILVPWSLLHFAQGNLHCGIGLLILYGVATLSRQALEPRLVGKQTGLPPLLTLLALYIGFRTVGVAGMILFPLGVIFLKQVWDHADLGRHD